MEIKLKKNKLLFIVLGFIFYPLAANANTINKIDWIQISKTLYGIDITSANEPLENESVQVFKLTKEEKLFIECEEYQYSYYKPEKCWSNYNRYRNNTNLSYDHWLPSTSKFDRKKPHHSYYPKSFKDWDKYKNGAYSGLK